MTDRPRGGIRDGLRAVRAGLPRRARELRGGAERRFPVITRLAARLLTVNVLDAGTRLAAQVFLTAVPLIFVVTSLAPDDLRRDIFDSLEVLLGLDGASQQQLSRLAEAEAGNLRETVGAVGSLMVLLSATACSRSMQRVCERAWRLPKSAARIAVWRWFAWVVTMLVVVFLLGPLRDAFGVGEWLGVPLSLACGIAVWWWTQHLLLGGRVGWRRLFPGAVLTAAVLEVAYLAAPLYVPRALNRSLEAYGSLGSVFTLLSCLIAACVAVAVCITFGAVLSPEQPPAGVSGGGRRPRSP
ncbi:MULTISPECIES: YhjD/YihY/BrkB family envelope integrity protein [unclassified Streptomyces]|uniref:YhjD/YihY/BrkB family envelope integrity protein n=1 Tax=unclassified Streptomyces TaxID=2593676 RepID=UPI0037F68711